MTIRHLFMYLLIFSTHLANGQMQVFKKNIDTSVFGKWGFVSGASITNDGKYAGYMSQFGEGNPKTLTIKSISGIWTKEFGPGVLNYAFSDDSRSILLQVTIDTLVVAELGTNRILTNYKASSFTQFYRNGVEWLLLKSNNNSLMLINTSAKKESRYENIISFYQDKAFNKLFLLSDSNVLSLVDLGSLKETVIGEYPGISNIVLNEAGDKVAFLLNKAIWLYDSKKGKSRRLIGNESSLIDTSLLIGDIKQFSHDGNRLFISLTKEENRPKTALSLVNVRVWNYQDSRLRTDPGNTPGRQSFLSFVDLKTGYLTRIQYENEKSKILNSLQDEAIAIEYAKGTEYEKHWNPLSKPKYYIYDCHNKKRDELKFSPSFLSPDGRFIFGFDSLNVEGVVYDLFKKSENGVTTHLGHMQARSGVVMDDTKRWLFAGWTHGHFALLYDENDIWKIDLSNPFNALCLTGGLGKRENLIFRLLNASFNKTYERTELEHFSVVNNRDKSTGFYKQMHLGSTKDPVKLIMTDAFFGFTLKARDADVWLSNKQRVDNSPNYYATKDLKTFKSLSTLYPEREYNWPTAELINFTTKAGQSSQAIVYKPGNFDPNKKYPVIINLYEKFTSELHHYIIPEALYDNINIPWFTSHGYIICKPDIIYQPMKSADGALSSIEGVASHMANLPYIDPLNIGLDGHSWGAFETNFIVSHSNFFKAAASTSGYANLISSVNSISIRGINYSDIATYTRYGRLGKTLWERPDIYTKYSPIMDASKITTPLLLMANENDGVVNVEQGVQFFYSLRRLGKRAWLLQYKDEGHSLFAPENQIDFGLKMLGFFDYYLKGKPMPKWMNEAN